MMASLSSDYRKFGLSRNALYSGFQAVITLFCTFVTLRILVNEVGVHGVGLWAILFSIISMGRVLDVSGVGGMAHFVSRTQSENGDTAAYINAMVIVNLIFGTVTSVIIFLHLERVLIFALKDEVGSVEISLAKWIVVNNLILMPLSLGVASAIDGLKRSDVRARIIITSNVLVVTLVYFFVPRIGLKGYAYSLLVQNLFILIVSSGYISLRINRLFYGVRRINKNIVSDVLLYGAKLQINNVASMFTDPIVKYYLNKYAGLEQVGYFEVASKLVLGLRGVVVQMTIPLIPEFSDISLKQDRLKNIFASTYRLLFFCSIALVVIVAAASPVYSYFLFQRIDWTLLAVILALTIAYVFNIYSIPYYNLGVGRNVWRWNIFAQIVVGLTVSVTAFVLGFQLSFKAIVASFCVGIFFASVCTIVGNRKLLLSK